MTKALTRKGVLAWGGCLRARVGDLRSPATDRSRCGRSNNRDAANKQTAAARTRLT